MASILKVTAVFCVVVASKAERNCQAGDDCSGHGKCEQDICTCEPSWIGHDCSFSLGSGLEQEKAARSDLEKLPSSVQKAPSAELQTAPTNAVQCQGGCGDGTCIAGACRCPEGRFGPSCADVRCAHDCWGHGTCGSGMCRCQSGWFGQHCGLQEAVLFDRLEGMAQEAVKSAAETEAIAIDLAQRVASADDTKAKQVAEQNKVKAHEAKQAKAAKDAKDAEAAAEKIVKAKVAAVKAAADEVEKAKVAAAARAASEAEAWKGSLQLLHSGHSSPAHHGGCASGCSGHGECNVALVAATGARVNSCTCMAGWAGDFCDQPRCKEDCSSHGFCVDGACLCEHNFYGSYCQNTRCPSDCSGHGYCFQGECKCSGLWSGETCSTQSSNGLTLLGAMRQSLSQQLPAPILEDAMLEDASSRTSGTISSCAASCSGHGSCPASPNTCECEEGWSGTNCAVELTCPDELCSGQGTCMHGRCTCDTGFQGPACEVVLHGFAGPARVSHSTGLEQEAPSQDNKPVPSTKSANPMTASWIPQASRAELVEQSATEWRSATPMSSDVAAARARQTVPGRNVVSLLANKSPSVVPATDQQFPLQKTVVDAGRWAERNVVSLLTNKSPSVVPSVVPATDQQLPSQETVVDTERWATRTMKSLLSQSSRSSADRFAD